jgi:hypothetical protein
MKRISSGTTPRRRTIDELDTDLLTTLEELDKRLEQDYSLSEHSRP